MSKLRITTTYGVIPNSVLNNKNLSFKAKGLFGYLQSKPDGREFSAERITHDSKESRDSVNTGLKELEKYGLLVRCKNKNERGQRDREYVLHEIPVENNIASTELPLQENPAVEMNAINKERVSKKETVINNNNILSKDNTTEVVFGDSNINNLIEHIESCCSKHGLIYSGKGKRERMACKRLLGKPFQEKIAPFGYNLFEFVNNVILVSTITKYTTKHATSAVGIYYNWEELVNLAKKQKAQIDENKPKQAVADLSHYTR